MSLNPASNSRASGMHAGEHATVTGQGTRVFATTRWTVILQAGGPTSEGSIAALEHLCRTYWYPVYSFARRTGAMAHDAEDLTQGFFSHLLERDIIARADRDRGRFRNFLLGALKHYRANERSRLTANKRGGGKSVASFDELEAEERYRLEPATDLSPEKLFDRKWAASLLDQVMKTLRAEYAVLGKQSLFDSLRGIIWGGRQPGGYELLAREVGMTEAAFKVAVHRLRARFKECLRQEVAHTVATPGEVDDELRHLLNALAS